MKRFNITFLLVTLGIGLSVAQIPTDGLVASYPFNGNANDESGHGNDGTVHGAILTQDRFGNAESALEFDGVDDFVTLPNVIPITKASISYWINTDRIGNEGQIVVYHSNTIDNGFGSTHDALETHTGISQKGGFYSFKNGNINTSPQVSFTDSIVMKPNSWFHITLTYDINDSIKFYVNGKKLNAQLLNGLSFDDHTPVYTYLGRPSISTRYFDGIIDDLYIYSDVLSETEIDQLYDDFHNSPSEDDGLVLHLPFDGDANDVSGNGYDGIVYGAELTEDRFGTPNGAYYFDGVDDTIAIQKPLGDMTEMSISFWLNSEMEGNTKGNIFCDGTVNTGGDDFLINVSSSAIGMRADKGVGFNFEDSSPAELSGLNLSNSWHHIVWSFNQSSSEVYLDGDLLVSISQAASNATNHDPTPIIGAREVWSNKDNFFKGKIDDFKIYNRKVAIDEVESLYKDGSSLEFVTIDKQALQNEVISYPVLVKGFENILTAQYTITWDPAVLEYQGVQDFGFKDLSESSFHLYNDGTLTFSWNAEDLIAETVPDSSVIFNVQFKAIGAGGTSSAVQFGDTPTIREVADGDGNVVDASYIDGSVTILDAVRVGGYIKTQSGEALSGIDVYLTGSKEESTVTDKYGWYDFEVIANQEYTISPSYDTYADNGVTTIDIVVMHWHILAKKFLMTNYDLIASDVNASNALTTLDLAITRAVILHTKNSFGDRASVEFINHEYLGDPNVFDYENSLTMIPGQTRNDLNFIAVKLGDASTSWRFNKNSSGREEGLEEIDIILEQGVVIGNIVHRPISFSEFDDLVGLQFTMEWDPEVYQFEKLNDGLLHLESNLDMTEEGKLTVSWNTESFDGISLNAEDIISDVQFRKLRDDEPQLEITSGITPALAYNSRLESFRISSQGLFNELKNQDFKIYPNPVTDQINIVGIDEIMGSQYAIINSIGSMTKSGNLIGESTVSVGDLTPGLYILKVTDPGGRVYTSEIIKR